MERRFFPYGEWHITLFILIIIIAVVGVSLFVLCASSTGWWNARTRVCKHSIESAFSSDDHFFFLHVLKITMMSVPSRMWGEIDIQFVTLASVASSSDDEENKKIKNYWKTLNDSTESHIFYFFVLFFVSFSLSLFYSFLTQIATVSISSGMIHWQVKIITANFAAQIIKKRKKKKRVCHLVCRFFFFFCFFSHLKYAIAAVPEIRHSSFINIYHVITL